MIEINSDDESRGRVANNDLVGQADHLQTSRAKPATRSSVQEKTKEIVKSRINNMLARKRKIKTIVIPRNINAFARNILLQMSLESKPVQQLLDYISKSYKVNL
jgi:hypothetical protein